MPGYLLNMDSQVLCAHGGQGKPVLPILRVKVMGKPVVGQTTPYTIAGCPYQLPSVPPVPFPCVIALNWAPPAARVKAMGVAVLLMNSKATCLPNGVPTNVIPVQARVRGA